MTFRVTHILQCVFIVMSTLTGVAESERTHCYNLFMYRLLKNSLSSVFGILCKVTIITRAPGTIPHSRLVRRYSFDFAPRGFLCQLGFSGSPVANFRWIHLCGFHSVPQGFLCPIHIRGSPVHTDRKWLTRCCLNDGEGGHYVLRKVSRISPMGQVLLSTREVLPRLKENLPLLPDSDV